MKNFKEIYNKIIESEYLRIFKEEVERNYNLLSSVSVELNNLKEQISQKTNPKIEYYNNKYPKLEQTYQKKFLNELIQLDVRCFVGHFNNFQLPTITRTDDEKAIKALQWVVSNIKYLTDQSNKGLAEYWNASFETLNDKKGDCEDGAILLYDLLRKNNVPAWKIRVVTGNAINPWNGKVDGHAYLSYYSEEYNKWVPLDWCYLPNIEEMKNQPEYKDVSFYGDIWFSFNEEYAWGKNKWS